MNPDCSTVLHSGYFHPTVRSWQVRCTRPCLSNMIFPVFVCEGSNSVEDIASLPGQKRYTVDKLVETLEPLVAKGLKSVLLFGVLKKLPKTEEAKSADSDDNPVVCALMVLATAFPDLLLCCDVCLCAYTSHGHCGIFSADSASGKLELDNSKSIRRIAQVALKYAKSGAHVVAPSDMMDGRVSAVKSLLVQNHLGSRVAVMAYSAKFASCFYGPFRDAAESAPSFGDRSTYQLPAGSSGLANRALSRDVNEGADILMVKPGLPYLDVLKSAKDNHPDYPLAVYQVSGEYAMLIHAANAKTFDLKAAVFETLNAFHRAGADIVISYFVPYLTDVLS